MDAATTRPWRVIGLVTGANGAGMLPFFVIAALAPHVRESLGTSEFGIGLAAASFFLGATLTAVIGGQLAERLGYRRSIVLGCVAASLGLLATASAERLWSMVALLALAGCGNALVQPAANGLFSQHLSDAHQSLAFGIKQASVPVAALFTGLASAALGETLAWRPLFALAAALPLLAAALVSRLSLAVAPPLVGPAHGASVSTRRGRSLLFVSASGLLASGAASGIAAFYVEGAVAVGHSAAAASLWYSGGAAAGVVARIGFGWLGGRLGRLFPTAALLMLVGAMGPIGLAHEPPSLLRSVATVLAWAAGWGWAGIFNYGVVRAHRGAPAAASGIALTGLFAGSVVGPAAFGAGVVTVGWTTTWWLSATVLVLAGVVLLATEASQVRRLPTPPRRMPSG